MYFIKQFVIKCLITKYANVKIPDKSSAVTRTKTESPKLHKKKK